MARTDSANSGNRLALYTLSKDLLPGIPGTYVFLGIRSQPSFLAQKPWTFANTLDIRSKT